MVWAQRGSPRRLSASKRPRRRLPLAEQVSLQHGGTPEAPSLAPAPRSRTGRPCPGSRAGARRGRRASPPRGRAPAAVTALGPVLTAGRSPRVPAARPRRCHGRAAAPGEVSRELTAYLVVRGADAALRSGAAAAGAPVASGAEEAVRGRLR